MGCKGLHCEGCSHGGGSAAGAVIALLVIIALALRKAWPEIVSAVEIAAWTVAGVTGAAIVITAGVLTVRALRRRRARRALIYRPGQPFVVVVDEVQSLFTQPLPPSGRPASGQIEPPSAQSPRWPVTGWWHDGEHLRPRTGGDGDERRPR
jgi:hypothetical protein